MNILTGVVFCALAFSYIGVKGSKEGSKQENFCLSLCAVSLICMILFAGYWMAVLLGRL